MPYQAQWYLPYKVIEARVWGRMTLEDWEQHRQSSARMLTEAQIHAPGSTVYLLMDTLDAESMPPIYLTIPKGQRVLKFKNRGTLFLIVQNDAIRSIMEVTAHITSEPFLLRIFKERQAALDALTATLAKDALR